MLVNQLKSVTIHEFVNKVQGLFSLDLYFFNLQQREKGVGEKVRSEKESGFWAGRNFFGKIELFG